MRVTAASQLWGAQRFAWGSECQSKNWAHKRYYLKRYIYRGPMLGLTRCDAGAGCARCQEGSSGAASETLSLLPMRLSAELPVAKG